MNKYYTNNTMSGESRRFRHVRETQGIDLYPEYGFTIGNKIRSAAATVGKIAALSFVSISTSLVAYEVIDNDKSPSEAIGAVYDFARYGLGRDLCPDLPDDSERAALGSLAITPPDRAIEDARAVAEAAGLHFAEVTPTREAILDAPSASAATQAVSEFTESNYGFDVTLDVTELHFEDPENVAAYQDGLQSFVSYTSLMPTELLSRLELSSLTLRYFAPDEDSVGRHLPDTNGIQIDFRSINNPSHFIHEALGHAAHHQVCSGFPRRDGAYTGYNPDGFSYGGPQSEFAPGVTVEEYGARDNLEDVATLITNYLCNEPLAFSELNTYPILIDKLTVVLDRLDDLAPGSAAYLAHTRGIFWFLTAAARQSN